VAGCRPGACEFRLGPSWTQQRLAGAREPHLRRTVDRTRWATAWADAGDEDQLRAALQALRGRRGAAQPHTASEVPA
jgi:coenzyme F420-reducing hydrogenase delta subunit